MSQGIKRYNALSEVWPVIEKMNLCDRKIAIFGYSRVHILFAQELKKRKKIASIIFIDNNADNQVIQCKEHIVVKPDLLSTKYRDYFVLIFSWHAKAMKRQLDDMGLKQDSQYIILKDLSAWQKEMQDKFIYEHNGNREIDRKERKNILLEMLFDIKNICEKHGLKYYLDGGTLLGAARHKGMIPWDHDLDIMMPFKDAMMLGELMAERKEYGFSCLSEIKEHNSTLPKIHRSHTRTLYCLGYNHLLYETPIYVDLDIFGGYGNDRKTADLYQKEMRQCCRDFYEYLILECSGKNKEDEIKKVMDMQHKMCYETSTYVGKIYGCAEADYFLKDSINPPEYLLFEGKTMPVPKNYKYILEMYYGNYMKLPPVEERETEMNHAFFWV